MKILNRKMVLFTSSIVVFVIILFFQIKIFRVIAQSSVLTLSGYAWSENTGWISFNPSDNGNNSVSVDSNGYLNGYAWSENIGWIKFGNTTSVVDPDGGDGSAYYDEYSKSLYGYARACSGTYDGVCGGATHTYTPTPIVYNATDYYWQENSSIAPYYSEPKIFSNNNSTKMVQISAYAPINISSDGGSTWVQKYVSKVWQDIAISSDGSKIVAVESSPSYNWGDSSYAKGYIHTSSDGGYTWTQHTTNPGLGFWTSVTSSDDGSKIAVVDTNTGNSEIGYIYTSSDGGTTWTANTTAGKKYWRSVSYSSDGSKLVAVGSDPIVGYPNYPGFTYIYVSNNNGASWTSTRIYLSWDTTKVSISSDNTKMVYRTDSDYYGATSRYVIVSSDGGNTWSKKTGLPSGGYWADYASISPSGNKIFVIGDKQFANGSKVSDLFMSSNLGSTWTKYSEISLSSAPYPSGTSFYGPIINISNDDNKINLRKYMPPAVFGGLNYYSLMTGAIGQVSIPQDPVTDDSRSDVWDGWISLSDSTGSGAYGVKLDGTTPSFAWGSDVVGWLDFSQVSFANNDMCSNISGDQSSLPANTQLNAGACVCLSAVSTEKLKQNASTGACTCENGGAWDQPSMSCVQVCSATSVIIKLSPEFVATPSGMCTLTWNVSNYNSGGVNGVCPVRSTSCLFDGVDVTNSSSTGVSMPIGTHTLVCGDGYSSSTKSVKCKLSPSYGEF